jgi:transforming growth factor-beta-induced protein
MKKLLALSALSLGLLLAPARVDAGNKNEPTILEVALQVNQDTGEFSTLIAAAVHADLADLLDFNRQVFAPTDAAFADLGLDAANVTELPVDVLTDILLYHVSPGQRFSDTVAKARRIRMMNKSFTFVSADDSGVFLNDAQVILPDIDCSNGVIHVIDAVLLPLD